MKPVVLAAAGAGLLAAVLGGGQAVVALSHAAPCVIPSEQYRLKCFSPRDAGHARKALAQEAIDPSGAVRRGEGLRLTRVILGTRVLPAGSKEPVILEFDYGSVPGEPVATASSAPWVAVVETAFRFKGLKTAVLFRTTSQTVTTVGFTTGAAGYWQLRGNMAARRLALSVTSNLPRVAVRSIGCGLLKANAGGACAGRGAP